ncbi:MAG: Gfo/Idh/MocA family oxidoreductase [Abditibacteriota bacterium]|nr:Gfo/Idh/MocA family oxidoreductase [Abditibacteriota bacterium]
MTNKLKVAIVGAGGISEVHIAGYKALDNVELYALCDINEERLREKGARHGVTRLFTDEAEMLKALPEIDAVSVTTWNSQHAPCTIMALEAGKHVICEKPMAMNAKEAAAMEAAAKKAGKLLMIGFVRRFGNDCAVLKDFIDSGDFGEIYYAKANYTRRNGCPGGWFGDKSRSGGGPLIDLGVHVIDLVR